MRLLLIILSLFFILPVDASDANFIRLGDLDQDSLVLTNLNYEAKCVGGWKRDITFYPRIYPWSHYSYDLIDFRVPYRTGTDSIVGDSFNSIDRIKTYYYDQLALDIIDHSNTNIYSGSWVLKSSDPADSAAITNIRGYSAVVGLSTNDSNYVANFTHDTSGISVDYSDSIQGYTERLNYSDNIYYEVSNSWRRSYNKNMIEHFGLVNWFDESITNRPYWPECGINYRYPRSIELWGNYSYYRPYDSKLKKYLGNNDYPNDPSGTPYTNCIVALGGPTPTKMNREFFWPELQDKLRFTSAYRNDYSSSRDKYLNGEATPPYGVSGKTQNAIQISPHYAIKIQHWASSGNLRLQTNAVIDAFVNLTGGTLRFLEWDIFLYRTSGAELPEDFPYPAFVGAYGNENYSSLYHLSHSLNSMIGICKSQHATVHPLVIDFKFQNYETYYESKTNAAPHYHYCMGMRHTGSHVESNTITKVDLRKWVDPQFCTNQYDVLDSNGYWNCVPVKTNGVWSVPSPRLICNWSFSNTSSGDPYYKEYSEVMATITNIPNDNIGNTVPLGYHLAHIGDSGCPVGLFYNNYFILVGMYTYIGSGPNLCDPVLIDILDQSLAAQSKKELGVEEHLRIINCCDLDPEHKYHEH